MCVAVKFFLSFFFFFLLLTVVIDLLQQKLKANSQAHSAIDSMHINIHAKINNSNNKNIKIKLELLLFFHSPDGWMDENR